MSVPMQIHEVKNKTLRRLGLKFKIVDIPNMKTIAFFYDKPHADIACDALNMDYIDEAILRRNYLTATYPFPSDKGLEPTPLPDDAPLNCCVMFIDHHSKAAGDNAN